MQNKFADFEYLIISVIIIIIIIIKACDKRHPYRIIIIILIIKITLHTAQTVNTEQVKHCTNCKYTA